MKKTKKINLLSFLLFYIHLAPNILLNISDEEIEYFFKKGFYGKGKGRGYGLYNVKKTIKKYKGKIKGIIDGEDLVIVVLT